MPQGFLRRYLLCAALVLGAWALLALVVAPHLIRSGYANESFSFINGIFGGRDVHDVGRYLAAWRRVAILCSIILVLTLFAAGLWFGFPLQRLAVIDRVLGGDPDLTPAMLLLLAAELGFLAGAAEAVYLAILQVVTTRPGQSFFPEFLWMAPLAAAIAALVIGAVLALIASGGTRGFSLRTAVFLFAFPVFYSIAQSPGIALYTWAELLLTAGLAMAVARFAASHGAAAQRWIRRAAPVLLLAVAALSTSGYLTTPAAMERRAAAGLPDADRALPNVLLIILDTARAANFSLFGYARPTSPELEAWARDGVVFERALSVSSWTLPAHASMFTGEHNHVLGTGFDRPLDRRFRTLAEVLFDHGYATAGFTANLLYTTSMSGVHQGFARYEDRPIDLPHFLRSAWLSSRIIADPLGRVRARFAPSGRNAAEVTDAFFDWFATRDTDRPFFAFLNFFDAHEPYPLPEAWEERFGPAPETDWWDFSGAFRPDEGSQINDEGIDRWIARYDAAIAWIDHHIGLIRDRLRDEGLDRSTIVIVTADHGEMWGEHGEISHAKSLYMPVVHVPLVIVHPGRVPAATRVSENVSVRDIPATLAELTGIGALDDFPGQSLAPLWRGEVVPRDAPLMELENHPIAKHPDWAPVQRGPMKSLLIGDLHYIRNGDGVEQLFDIARDPQELHNLASDPAFASELARFRSTLAALPQPD